MSTVITVENLGKKYLLSHKGQQPYVALRDVITDGVKGFGSRFASVFHRSPVPGPRSLPPEDFWALKDVSFEVKQGDRIGIIGRNGAGKSTLLKILSRITEPTAGRVTIKGRVASLLEVGTGFHPELTGRENIYLNGAILGMSRAEIRAKFDEIVDFAEIEKFLDTPVKRYSSGMYVRLAFAVAAHLEPEILVVDEVLAVGDAQFQKKCLGKMEEVSASGGRTVLFVSHNMDAARKLCNKGLLLKQGRIIESAASELVISRYIAEGYTDQADFQLPLPHEEGTPGYAYRLVVENHRGEPRNEVSIGEPWQIRIYFKLLRRIEEFIIGLGFLTEMNAPLRTSWSTPQDLEAGDYEVVFREELLLMTSGVYPLVVGLSSHGRAFQYEEHAAFLRIGEITQGVNLVKTQNVGLILNPMHVEICSKEG